MVDVAVPVLLKPLTFFLRMGYSYINSRFPECSRFYGLEGSQLVLQEDF
jgi:hypothetical protein